MACDADMLTATSGTAAERDLSLPRSSRIACRVLLHLGYIVITRARYTLLNDLTCTPKHPCDAILWHAAMHTSSLKHAYPLQAGQCGLQVYAQYDCIGSPHVRWPNDCSPSGVPVVIAFEVASSSTSMGWQSYVCCWICGSSCNIEDMQLHISDICSQMLPENANEKADDADLMWCWSWGCWFEKHLLHSWVEPLLQEQEIALDYCGIMDVQLRHLQTCKQRLPERAEEQAHSADPMRRWLQASWPDH